MAFLNLCDERINTKLINWHKVNMICLPYDAVRCRLKPIFRCLFLEHADWATTVSPCINEVRSTSLPWCWPHVMFDIMRGARKNRINFQLKNQLSFSMTCTKSHCPIYLTPAKTSTWFIEDIAIIFTFVDSLMFNIIQFTSLAPSITQAQPSYLNIYSNANICV